MRASRDGRAGRGRPSTRSSATSALAVSGSARVIVPPALKPEWLKSQSGWGGEKAGIKRASSSARGRRVWDGHSESPWKFKPRAAQALKLTELYLSWIIRPVGCALSAPYGLSFKVAQRQRHLRRSRSDGAIEDRSALAARTHARPACAPLGCATAFAPLARYHQLAARTFARALVVKLDLQDLLFRRVHFRRVQGLMVSLGIRRRCGERFARLTTYRLACAYGAHRAARWCFHRVRPTFTRHREPDQSTDHRF